MIYVDYDFHYLYDKPIIKNFSDEVVWVQFGPTVRSK